MDALEPIKQKIFEIRGQRVMLDRDLAAIYGVETRALNQAVRRNIERFPEDFMFQLTRSEWEILKSQSAALDNWISQNVISSQPDNQQEELLTSQFVILKKGRGKHPKYLPYAGTHQPVAGSAAVQCSFTQAPQTNRLHSGGRGGRRRETMKIEILSNRNIKRRYWI